MNKANRRTYIIAAIVLLFCECFFFRNIIGTGTGAMLGDRVDGRLTALLTEHWWSFFNGKEKFSEIAMFYPAEGVFGYTDLFLGYGLIHSIFRLFGINMFASYTYTLLVVHVIGTISMYYLMNKKLKCNVWWSLFGTLAFCFSDTYARHLGHTQLNAISALPILLILLLGFIDNYENRRKRNIYAYGFMTWFVLLTYTSWYIACFTGVFSLVFLIVYFIKLKKYRVTVFPYLKKKILLIGKDFIGYMIFIIVLYIPFIKVYMPAFKSTSGYSYSTCVMYMPEFADIINVSGSNFMLGKLIKILNLSDRGYSGEVKMGFSIILLGLFLVLFAVNNNRGPIIMHNEEIEGNVFIKIIPNVTFISILACIVLTVRLSSNGVSLWAIVYYLLPVARSMRAVARFLLWLSFPMAVITAYMANRYINTKSRIKTVIISCVAVILLFVSNINTVGVYSNWGYMDEYSFISSVSKPPEDAEVFYIIDTVNTEGSASANQLDAFEIATWYSLKTINGHSGKTPADWSGIRDIGSNGYEGNIFRWVKKYGLKNVYAYDRAMNTWILGSERILQGMDDVFYPAENKFSISTGLEDWGQGNFAWTSKNFETHIKNAGINDTGLVIKMRTQLSNYMAQNADLIPTLQIYVDKELVQEVAVTDDYIELNIPMSDHDEDVYDVEIKTNCYFNPKNIGVNADTRDLSIALYYIGN